MKDTGSLVLTGLAAAAVGVLVLITVPMLQSAEQRGAAAAALEIERATRLLHEYNATWTRSGVILASLRGHGVDVDFEDPEAVDAFVEAASEAYQAEHDKTWSAITPMEWLQTPPREAGRPSYGDIRRQVEEGAAARNQMLKANAATLDEALKAVDAALQAGAGESDPTTIEANRLKGIILFHKGIAQQIEANALRRQINPHRSRVLELADQVAANQPLTTVLADSGIEAQISQLSGKLQSDAGALEKSESELSSLDARIADLEGRIAAARQRADAARTAMDELRTAGVDYTAQDGAARFRTEYERLDADYRAALSEAYALEHGNYSAAEIDASGDYIKGAYVEEGRTDNLAIEHGLVHYQRLREALAAKVAGNRQGLETLRADIARLEELKATYARNQAEAQSAIASAQTAAQQAYDDWNRVESEAETAEDAALETFERSAAAFRAAGGAAERRLSDLSSRAQALSPTAQERSAFKEGAADRWMRGFIGAEAADALLASAWVYEHRYRDRLLNAKVLSQAAGPLNLAEADAQAQTAAAAEAQTAGVTAVSDALALLQTAHGQAERHWTIVAQTAGTAYVLALLGDPSYRKDAADAYEAALKGREDEPYAAALVARWRQLASRR